MLVLALALVGGAGAELAAPRAQDGMLALTTSGRPVVAYVRGTALELATRRGPGRWSSVRVAAVPAGATVAALAAGAAGPVAVVQSADTRTVILVRRSGPGWSTIRLAGGPTLPAGVAFGWPGLALDKRGRAAVAFTRWQRSSRKSVLQLVRLDARGRSRIRRITAEGFPKSYVPPPAVPVYLGGALRVIETYGYEGAVGTIEWRPGRRVWGGQFLDSGIGDFPVGRLLAAVAPSGTVYAAWTEALLGTGELPVLLAAHGRSIESDVVQNRALTAGLVARASGVAVAANEWVSATDLDLEGDAVTWAGTLTSGHRRVELDGWLAGLASARSGERDLLLAQPRGLSWFRSRAAGVRVRVSATERGDGTVLVSGHVQAVGRGEVTIYRERPGLPRTRAGSAAIARDGSFSLTDRRPLRPLLYRAVYTQPATGIPYAALLRAPVR